MSGDAETIRFDELLKQTFEARGLTTDDALGFILPLMRQANEVHERGRVAPLDGTASLFVADGQVWFPLGDAGEPSERWARVAWLQRSRSKALNIVGEVRIETDLDELGMKAMRMKAEDELDNVDKPMYMPGFTCWEMKVGHHDALTDIFALGMLLASVVFGLDFSNTDDLEAFIGARGNLSALNPEIHPVVLSVVASMTQLYRSERSQDLPWLIARLHSYRFQPDATLDFAYDKQLQQTPQSGRKSFVLTRLRERLYDTTRRNRLIYFRSTMQSLNLTEASVPQLIDVRNIRPEQLIYYHGDLASIMASGRELNLTNYLRFEDSKFIMVTLDRIRLEAQRDLREYGFAQMRLAIAFLRWHNLKDSPDERIHSPLLLIPVELVKRKGVRDSYILRPTEAVAEVNPALRHYLDHLYGVKLPHEVGVSEPEIDEFFQFLNATITASEPGITLKKIDKPQVDLVFESARKRLDAYRRRTSAGQGRMRTYAQDLRYNYDRSAYQPLGLQLYLHRVKPSVSPYDHLVRAKARPRYPSFADALETALNVESVTQRVLNQSLVSVHTDGSDANPYVWDFDLCAVTLANFKYRKMTLVRDFDVLLEKDVKSESFDSVFSFEPKVPLASNSEPQLQDLALIVPSDPTQVSAIAHARSGRSYIIQGPPGTGKSQTITNLIADYASRGKRVLFVCEKRAAIDVVYHRLRQSGIHGLSVLIHDSQADKKEFIADIKSRYESAQLGDGAPGAVEEHATALEDIERSMRVVSEFSTAMSQPNEIAGIPLRSLIARLVELRADRSAGDETNDERILPYRYWVAHRRVVERMADTLVQLGCQPIFASHPLRHINISALQADQPVAYVRSCIEDARRKLALLSSAVGKSALDSSVWCTLPQIEAVADYAARVEELAKHDLVGLLDERSALSKQYSKTATEYSKREKKFAGAQKSTKNWQAKLSPEDTQDALAQATALEKSFFRFFHPGWWRLSKTLATCYSFAAHKVPPTFVSVLTDLHAEHEAAKSLAEVGELISQTYHTDDAAAFRQSLENLRSSIRQMPSDIQAYHARLLKTGGRDEINAVADLASPCRDLKTSLDLFFIDGDRYTIEELASHLTEIEASLGQLHELHSDLCDVLELPGELQRMIRTVPDDPLGLEWQMAMAALGEIYRRDRTLTHFTGRVFDRHVQSMEKAYSRWMTLNGQMIVDEVSSKFRERVRISNTSATQLSATEKALKLEYARGRRDLEHEFGKIMRYKSIRDLIQSDSGKVIFDLKPIWLMSPLSVADTLPLVADQFDVVVFDEASQIRLEEAVPALTRARQVIVVGDEMQLPPPAFFVASGVDEDDLTVEEDGESIAVDLSSDSFLSHTSQTMPSTMLRWHYRSREEALISFSNYAFYRGDLLTIPNKVILHEQKPEIVAASPADAEANLNRVLEQSISFHRLPSAVYEDRQNALEADYIAHLVRALLTREAGLSIGIVAFSEAQQSNIDAAIDKLAATDSDFQNRLEDEIDREVHGQLCGLFIKNLENVQGDERDVIILSICYGPDDKGKMMMNFGPINQPGGEKRLNVVFSRAKQHMVVVSSINHDAITNVYNDGAMCLRNYLEYSAAVSRGDQTAADRVLAALSTSRSKSARSPVTDVVVADIKHELKKRGWETDLGIGQSDFRCDLAVRMPGDPCYRVAIQVDTEIYYSNQNLIERCVLRPGILRAFGWQTFFVLSRDWLNNSSEVIAAIESRLTAEGPDGNGSSDENSEEESESLDYAADESSTKLTTGTWYGSASTTS